MKCPACRADDTVAIMPAPWLKCCACGLGLLAPGDLEARIGELERASYGDGIHYAPEEPGDLDHKARLAGKIVTGWNAIHGRGDIGTGTGTAFEVGFGNAGILAELSRRGWDTAGVDQARPAVDAARKRLPSTLNVGRFDVPDAETESRFEWADRKSSIQIRIPKGIHDLVIAWDAFEHIPDLKEAFRIASLLLKPQGVLAMHSPNLTNYGGNPGHPHMQDRSHLWHMTPAAARSFAEAAGLRPVKAEAGTCWGDSGYAHPDNFCLWAVKP